MGKFSNFTHNECSRAAWAISHISGADDASKLQASRNIKGSAPTKNCQIHDHSSCSGFHASKHGIKRRCTCSCHPKEAVNA